jgi:glycosyltransferase involved in cell wall biosynthesis
VRIAHVTAYCHVGSAGGTERYVRDLILGLNRLGHQNDLIWMTPDAPSTPPACAEAALHVWPRAAMRVDDPPPAVARLAETCLRSAAPPDILHFHTLGRSEAAVAACAARLRVPYVFTYHSPAWTCRRDTLLLWGRSPCDGEVRALRCSACKVQERTAGPAWAGYVGAVASSLLTPLRAVLSTGLRRRCAFTAESALYRASVRRFLAQCSTAVACAEWSIPVLQTNGMEPGRIVHLPQGVPDDFTARPTAPTREATDLCVVGYIGRMNEVKGIHLLVEAFRRTRYAKARLRVYGWSDAPALAAYGRELKRLAGDDARIHFIPEQPPAAMPAAYAGLSLLAIPSIWLETGPLTLLEALQSGVPVFGSARIGQRGLLEQYGRVVEPNSVEAWTRALESAFAAHEQGRWSRVQLRQPLSTMEDVARRMAEVYRKASGA